MRNEDFHGVEWRKASYSNETGSCVEVGAAWRKASYSNSYGSCVEVGAARRDVLVRDTKQAHLSDADRTVLPFTAQAWAAFTRQLKQ